MRRPSRCEADVVRRIARSLCGRRALQPLFEKLHGYALAGMNIGVGGTLDTSGELAVLDTLAPRWQARCAVVFDVGANVGAYARAVLERAPETARLYCFEPSRATFDLLQGAVGGDRRVTCVNAGFGDKEETIALYSDADGSGLASVYQRRLDHFGITLQRREEIRLTTIDAFCREHSVSFIDFLKLDVEGHELAVLRGAAGMLARDTVAAIQFEFGGCNLDSRTHFQDFFFTLHPRYRIFRVVADGLRPIDRYREIDEIFIPTNYIALSRALHG